MFCNLHRETKSCSPCVTFIQIYQYILYTVTVLSHYSIPVKWQVCLIYFNYKNTFQWRDGQKRSGGNRWWTTMTVACDLLPAQHQKAIKYRVDCRNMQRKATLMATRLQIIQSVMVALKKVWAAFFCMIYAHSSSKGQSAQFQSLLTFWVIIWALHLCKGGSQARIGHCTRISHHHCGAIFSFQ